MSARSVIAAASPDFSVDIDGLVAIARQAGNERVSRRTIHFWSGRKYIRPPFPHGGEMRYPLPAIGEVDCLARFAPRSVGVDRSCVARFVEVGTVPWYEAQASLTRLTTGWFKELEQMRKAAMRDPGYLANMGAVAAAKKGKTAIPRVGRQPAADRAQAFTHILAGLLNIDEDPEADAVGQRALETLYGMRTGRGGKALKLGGLVDNPGDVRLDPDATFAALKTASNGAVELARRLTEFLVLWHPLLLIPMISEDPTPFLELVAKSATQFTPDFYAFFFTQRLTVLVGRDHEELDEALAAFQCALGAAEICSEMSEADAARARQMLRPYPRAQLLLADRMTGAETGQSLNGRGS